MKHPLANMYMLRMAHCHADDTLNVLIDFKPLNGETEWYLFSEGRLISSGSTGPAFGNISRFDDAKTLTLFMRNTTGYAWKIGWPLDNAGDLTPETKACALLLGLPLP